MNNKERTDLKKKNDQCQAPAGPQPKKSIIHIIQVQEGKEKEGRPKNGLKEIMAENLKNLAKDINPHIQEPE